MSKRFPEDGSNYKFEYRATQAEFNFKKGKFRVKSFTPYDEYVKDADPLFYFEDSDFIVAPAFYAPVSQQEPGKPPKFITVKGCNEIISEDIMKEACCLHKGTFHPKKKHLGGIVVNFFFKESICYASLTKGETVNVEDHYDYLNKHSDFLEKKLYYMELTQLISSLVTLEVYTNWRTVKYDDLDEFKRVTDKNNKKDPIKIANAMRFIVANDWTPVSKLMKMQENRAMLLPYGQLRYIKEDHKQGCDLPDDNASFFKMLVHAFYFEETQGLIYDEKFDTVPAYLYRDLNEAKERSKRGFSLEKAKLTFSEFTKEKISLFFKSLWESIRNHFQTINYKFYGEVLWIFNLRFVIYIALAIGDLIHSFIKVTRFVFRMDGISQIAEQKKEVKQKRLSNLNLKGLMRSFKRFEIDVLWALNKRLKNKKKK